MLQAFVTCLICRCHCFKMLLGLPFWTSSRRSADTPAEACVCSCHRTFFSIPLYSEVLPFSSSFHFSCIPEASSLSVPEADSWIRSPSLFLIRLQQNTFSPEDFKNHSRRPVYWRLPLSSPLSSPELPCSVVLQRRIKQQNTIPACSNGAVWYQILRTRKPESYNLFVFKLVFFS